MAVLLHFFPVVELAIHVAVWHHTMDHHVNTRIHARIINARIMQRVYNLRKAMKVICAFALKAIQAGYVKKLLSKFVLTKILKFVLNYHLIV